VQLTWTIFSQAQRVIAYLGNHFDGFEDALAWLQNFRNIGSNELPKLPKGLDFFQELGKRYNLLNENDERW
jgi:hypothetical protein